LDVARFDFARFAGIEERVRGQGIVLTTLATELACDLQAVAKAHALRVACWSDVPDADPMPEVTLAEFTRQHVTGPGALPAAHMLAKEADRYVGESCLRFESEREVPLHQFFTAVLSSYRGRGIALALKLQVIRHARAQGARFITTGIHARNTAMLGINEALGFRRVAGLVEFERDEAHPPRLIDTLPPEPYRGAAALRPRLPSEREREGRRKRRT
jgi:GNAT superfamily N-acetyltransferase